MKITWKNVYYPIGKWVNENGKTVEMSENFKCSKDGKEMICVMESKTGGGGHGEPRICASIPKFIDVKTMGAVTIGNGDFIDC